MLSRESNISRSQASFAVSKEDVYSVVQKLWLSYWNKSTEKSSKILRIYSFATHQRNKTHSWLCYVSILKLMMESNERNVAFKIDSYQILKFRSAQNIRLLSNLIDLVYLTVYEIVIVSSIKKWPVYLNLQKVVKTICYPFPILFNTSPNCYLEYEIWKSWVLWFFLTCHWGSTSNLLHKDSFDKFQLFLSNCLQIKTCNIIFDK